MSPVNDIHIHLREAPTADQSVLDERSHHRSHILYRNVRVDPVQIVQVGIVGLKPRQRGCQVLAYHGFQTLCGYFCGVQVQLCCQNDLFAEIMNRFADDALVVSPVFGQQVWAIGLGGIEKGASKS